VSSAQRSPAPTPSPSPSTHAKPHRTTRSVPTASRLASPSPAPPMHRCSSCVDLARRLQESAPPSTSARTATSLLVLFPSFTLLQAHLFHPPSRPFQCQASLSPSFPRSVRCACATPAEELGPLPHVCDDVLCLVCVCVSRLAVCRAVNLSRPVSLIASGEWSPQQK
jgi:hypothetical protein